MCKTEIQENYIDQCVWFLQDYTQFVKQVCQSPYVDESALDVLWWRKETLTKLAKKLKASEVPTEILERDEYKVLYKKAETLYQNFVK